MIIFLRCIVESVAEHGIRGLAEMVPGGAFASAVAGSAWKKYRELRRDAEVRAEIQQLAQTSFEDARKAAAEAVATIIPTATVVDRQKLEAFLSQVPLAVQQSLKRAEDPSGRTAPSGFILKSADDVLKLLPPRPPRFNVGDPLPDRRGWLLERPLGVGGFGEVWKVQQASTRSLLRAVKFFHGKQATDLQHESGLIDRVMSAGNQPGIVPLLDINLEGESPWLMFEYVQGGDLADWIRTIQSRPHDERVKLARKALHQLAETVAYFHRLTPPVVHRDLKPSNILLDRVNKRLRITDFGIGGIASKSVLVEEMRGGMTSGGRMLSYLRGSHTPLYASPQQRAGADPDPRDDVHALGVIGYQAITGLLSQGAGPDFAEDLRDAGASEGFVSLLGRCVAQKAERRPRDAGELVQLVTATPGPAPSPPQAAAIPTPAPVEPGAVASQSPAEPTMAELPGPVPVADLPESAEPAGEMVTASPGAVETATKGEQTTNEGDLEDEQPGIKGQEDRDPANTIPRPGSHAGEEYAMYLPGGVPLRFVWIPAGSYLKGSKTLNKNSHKFAPLKPVTIPTSFFISSSPITQEQWRAVMGKDPSRFRGDKRPVEQVTWPEAQKFCSKVSRILRGSILLRLPTESEWEYACRAGTTTEFWFSDEIRLDIANYAGDGTKEKPDPRAINQTTDVGSYSPNPWGLYDTHGNVWEWCEDRYDGMSGTGYHYRRGGSYESPSTDCHSGNRESWFRPRGSNGFRVCFTDPSEPTASNQNIDEVPYSLEMFVAILQAHIDGYDPTIESLLDIAETNGAVEAVLAEYGYGNDGNGEFSSPETSHLVRKIFPRAIVADQVVYYDPGWGVPTPGEPHEARKEARESASKRFSERVTITPKLETDFTKSIAELFHEFIQAVGEVVDPVVLLDPETEKAIGSGEDDKSVADQARWFELDSLDINNPNQLRRVRGIHSRHWPRIQFLIEEATFQGAMLNPTRIQPSEWNTIQVYLHYMRVSELGDLVASLLLGKNSRKPNCDIVRVLLNHVRGYERPFP